jgi:hypothetical protein
MSLLASVLGLAVASDSELFDLLSVALGTAEGRTVQFPAGRDERAYHHRNVAQRAGGFRCPIHQSIKRLLQMIAHEAHCTKPTPEA